MLRSPVLYLPLAFVLARRVAVRGWSMYPTLAPGDYVLCDGLAYRLEAPRRGDVVLATHPTEPRTWLIKRAVAVPGDRVALREGRWWLNGAPQGEIADAGPAPMEAEWALEGDRYFLLGDAPGASTDSRHFGPVARREIRARGGLSTGPPGGGGASQGVPNSTTPQAGL